MAVRPKGYGLTAELKAKVTASITLVIIISCARVCSSTPPCSSLLQKDAKFDHNLAQDAFLWIEEILSEPVKVPETQEDVLKSLKDGVMLCK